MAIMSNRRRCSECGGRVIARRPRNFRKKVFKPRDDHTLCLRCWTALVDSMNAKPLEIDRRASR
jgi:hypothetical protein